MVCLYEGDNVEVCFGPDTIFLAPHARPKICNLSGGTPVRPNALKVARLKLGPDFIRDQLVVRTRDNATLRVDTTFRWRFIVDTENPQKLFALKDFVGFAAQTLSSEIRETAAKHKFEDFHAKAAELVKVAIFGESNSRIFEENGLEIFGVDVEGITPEDPEIKAKLSDAIKTNVDIYTRRVQEEAKLENERILIEGKAKNEEERKALIALEVENQRTVLVEKAKTAAASELERANGEAEAIRIKAEAEREAEELRLKSLTEILATDGGKAFIELERAKALQETDKVIVPTDSKLVLGTDALIG